MNEDNEQADEANKEFDSGVADQVARRLDPEGVKQQSKIQIGGASTEAPNEGEDELNADFPPPQQTTITGLGEREDGEGQIEVIAPQYQQERTNSPTNYTSESQNTLEQELKKKNPAFIIIVVVGLALLVGAAYGAYLLLR